MAGFTDAVRRLWGRAPEAKASAAARLVALHSAGRPQWTPRDYRALAREGYQRNAVVYRAVRIVSEAAASLPWLLSEGGSEIEAHPLLDLLARPNARQSGGELMEAVYGHLMLAGNAYLEAVEAGGEVRELHALRPDRMRVVPGADGWPEAYEYDVGGRKIRFEQSGRQAPILHLTLFHPTDDHYGLSPLEAAQVALDVHNAASAWNKALLDNAARPSGALVYTAENGLLAREQYERLKAELEEQFAGARNAGRPLLLEGGLDWRAMGLAPKDMDFMEAKNGAAREIALAFGVPPMLLGIPGDNTYANYREANRTLWRQTVLPMASRVARGIAQWLAPGFGTLDLAHDLDAVHALAEDRESLWRRVSAADFLSDDEKRQAVGYGIREGG
ncbi:phage portal protein [Lutibaculum baratangense]|uniref:Phage portal protein n=1 Tax=Lutibaculum baratangense AMV1 TaxID=631454 RepID=V4RBK2_9HYPH|nr:phage portal protein [Lutibaculum baratangense]ESR22789.1 Phage portal protein [Lutibaculum baratangense AMV1]